MKTLIFLFVMSMFNFSAVNSFVPKDVKKGEKLMVVEKKYPNYHFKFYKKAGEVKFAFSMLGYWGSKEGCVLQFTNDTLMCITTFKNYKQYEEYITNSNEITNITINEKNLMLTSNE